MAARAAAAVCLAALMAAACRHGCWVGAQTTGCTPMMVNLSPCISYMASNMTAPPATCCAQLDNLVQTETACLCMLLAGGTPFPVPINRTRALSLPGACNIRAGPLDNCDAFGMGSPPVAPGPASPPPATPPPAGSGSKTASGGSAVGSSVRTVTAHPVGVLVAVAGHLSAIVVGF